MDLYKYLQDKIVRIRGGRKDLIAETMAAIVRRMEALDKRTATPTVKTSYGFSDIEARIASGYKTNDSDMVWYGEEGYLPRHEVTRREQAKIITTQRKEILELEGRYKVMDSQRQRASELNLKQDGDNAILKHQLEAQTIINRIHLDEIASLRSQLQAERGQRHACKPENVRECPWCKHPISIRA